MPSERAVPRCSTLAAILYLQPANIVSPFIFYQARIQVHGPAGSAAIYYSSCNNICTFLATKEVNMESRSRPGSDRALSGPLQSFDLDEATVRLREEREWQEGRRNAATLTRGRSKRGVACDEGWRQA